MQGKLQRRIEANLRWLRGITDFQRKWGWAAGWLVFAVSLSDVVSDRIRLTVFACKSYNPRFAFTGISG